MLSYDDALERILAAAGAPLPPVRIPLTEAGGRVLAEDLFATEDIPAFTNSAVDGFAVRESDLIGASANNPIVLPITQTIPAGSVPDSPLLPGASARILTGAMLPEGADAIVMVEDTFSAPPETPSAPTANNEGERVGFLAPGSPGFIRAAGSDVRAGTKVLSAGTPLSAGAIGLLAALGESYVSCARPPRVGLIVTGDEIVPVAVRPLPVGKIRDANGTALRIAIEEAGGIVAVQRQAGDSLTATKAALDACADCDLIVSTGGVSVGAYDYVKAAVETEGNLEFWRIAIKPGKPLAFGRFGKALFFGLPGNPVSSLVTFELFVRPVLRTLSGHSRPTRQIVSAVLTQALPHEPGRREFVRTQMVWKNDGFLAAPTGAQGSHRLSSLVGADALLIAHEDRGDYAAGERLPALWLGG